jgi:hypothetical protein
MTRLHFLLLILVRLLICSSEAADSTFAPKLSETGLFADVQTLTPASDLRPYDINVSFWSDGAEKKRWVRLPPREKIHYSTLQQWAFPVGTLFVKHFERPTEQPIETRVLRFSGINVFGASYRWRKDRRDADLLATNCLTDDQWYFPSAEDCRTCHNATAGFILGLNTRQINRAAPGSAENQLLAWSNAGLFDRELNSSEIAEAERLSTGTRESAIRAYLDVNCALCHRPGGTVSYFDARYASAIERLIDAPVLFNQGIDDARVISPHDPWRSILLLRLNTMDGLRMPPLAHQQVDTNAVVLFADWVQSLDGPEVTAPPKMEPAGGKFAEHARVIITHRDPAAIIRFTTNGAAPGRNSPIYNGPITLTSPTTLRARAYKENATRSVTVQETYLVESGRVE